MINDCIKIDKNICDINIINENIKKCNSLKVEIRFKPEENEINEFLKKIQAFGSIYKNIKTNPEENKNSDDSDSGSDGSDSD